MKSGWDSKDIQRQNNKEAKVIMSNATSSSSGMGAGGYRGGKPPNLTLQAWPVPNLDAGLKHPNETNYLMDKNIDSAKNYTFSLHNLNATGYVAIDDDLIDTGVDGLTDVQTFILAGIATVIPLLVLVVTVLGVKYLWKRYRVKKEEGYEGVLQKEESSEPLGKLQTYSLPQELKTSESQFTVTPGDLSSTPSTQLPTPKSNGSVITMTLKNNHLIVETEETTNMSEGNKIESKGTTTKFVTTNAPDFRFESHSRVSAGFLKARPESPSVHHEENPRAAPSLTNHGALVHNVPLEMEDELEKESCNTGLSQSDLSISSTESQNPSYRYGNQTGYDSGCYGYPDYSGYLPSNTSVKQPNVGQMVPKILGVYSKGTSVAEGGDTYQAEDQTGCQPFKDILASDIQAREKRVHDMEIQQQNACENGNRTVSDTTEASVPSGSCFSEATATAEPQPAYLKEETFKLKGNNPLLDNQGINCKDAEGS